MESISNPQALENSDVLPTGRRRTEAALWRAAKEESRRYSRLGNPVGKPALRRWKPALRLCSRPGSEYRLPTEADLSATEEIRLLTSAARPGNSAMKINQ